MKYGNFTHIYRTKAKQRLRKKGANLLFTMVVNNPAYKWTKHTEPT